MKTHDYKEHADQYATLGSGGTYYLAFRDMDDLLKRHTPGHKALDYGCGAGRSTRYLKSIGYDAIGVDISTDMLDEARQHDPSGEYHLIQTGQIPFEEQTFDVVISLFTLLEVPLLTEIRDILVEMKRVLKPEGCILIITSSSECYRGNWVSFSYAFPENARDLRSGETVKLVIRGTDIVLHDYYWTERDYENTFADAGLDIKEVLRPLGQEGDPVVWLDEVKFAPMLIYALKVASREE